MTTESKVTSGLLLAIVVLFALAMSLSSCTPTQAIANGNYIAGAQLATFALGKHPGSVPALQHLADVLPDIIIGKVPPREMGQLNAQLEPIFQEAGETYPNDRSVFVRIGSLLSAGSQISGQNPTVYQGIAIAAAISIANGIKDSIEFNKGRHDITDPPAVIAVTGRAAVYPKAKAKAKKKTRV